MNVSTESIVLYLYGSHTVAPASLVFRDQLDLIHSAAVTMALHSVHSAAVTMALHPALWSQTQNACSNYPRGRPPGWWYEVQSITLFIATDLSTKEMYIYKMLVYTIYTLYSK